MREVGVLEAKTHLSSLLAAVEREGEIITITRNGRPIATLRPTRWPSRPRLSGEELVAQATALRERYSDLEAEAAEPLDLRSAMERD